MLPEAKMDNLRDGEKNRGELRGLADQIWVPCVLGVGGGSDECAQVTWLWAAAPQYSPGGRRGKQQKLGCPVILRPQPEAERSSDSYGTRLEAANMYVKHMEMRVNSGAVEPGRQILNRVWA